MCTNPSSGAASGTASMPARSSLYSGVGLRQGRLHLSAGLCHPENNYLGIDITDKVLILAKRKIEAAYQAAGRPIDNVKIMSTDIERIKGVITPEDEVSRIYINFCNPWSKNDSSHKHRLTYRAS